MSAPHVHIIQDGDQPDETLAKCGATGCGFSFRHKNRNIRMAACFRHLADVFEAAAQTKENNDS